MNQSSLWRGVIIVFLCAVIAAPAQGQYGPGKVVSNGTIAGAIVGAVAAVAVVIIVVVHYSKKRAITGCVSSAENGLTITDERDKQVYLLSGSTTGIKAGDRVELRGKKIKSKGTDTMWKTTSETKDFGVCPT